MPDIFASLRRFRRHDGGNMMIEFALALPVLSLMLIGMLDLGRFAIDKSSMLQAANAGAQYGVVASNAGSLSAADLNNVNSTAQGATSLTGVTASNSVFCECTSGVSVTCTSTCSGGSAPKHYLTVTTTRAFTSVVKVTGISFGTFGSWTAPTQVSASVTTILP